MKIPTSILAVLGAVLLLGALGLVTWRQSRALERLAELDALERRVSLLQAERDGLESRVQALESRGRVVPAARDRLGMRMPTDEAGEWVLLTGATP